MRPSPTVLCIPLVMFYELLGGVGTRITKKLNFCRTQLEPVMKLAVTFRHPDYGKKICLNEVLMEGPSQHPVHSGQRSLPSHY